MSVSFYHDQPYQPPLFVPAEESEETGHLLIQIKPAMLRQSEVNGWFFLQPELKGPMSQGTFVLSLDMVMELAVRPDLIYRYKGLLNEYGDPIHLLQGLAWEASQPGASEPDPLLKVDGWLCLGVEQQHPAGVTGFRTLWDQILPQMVSQGVGPKDLDFHHLEIFLNQKSEDADAKGLNIEFGEDGKRIMARWPLKDSDRLTPGTPIEEEERSAKQLGLLAAVGRVLEGQHIPFALQGGDGLRFSHGGKQGRWSCEVKVWEEEGTVAFYSLYPLQATEEQQESLEAWTNQINQQLSVGSFAFERSSRDLRLRTSASFAASAGLESQLLQLWQQNVRTFDRHYQEIHRLMTT
ncbi:MAG: YbjN domain-containing protein [Bacteroidota bacterium]